MLYWNGERNVRGWLARTAVRHLETISGFFSRSAHQGLKGSRTRDLSWFKYVCGTNLTLYWFKDSMIMIWLKLLCNMWRLLILYESCSFQFKECEDVCQTKTQWGHWPTSPTCPCGVWESQEVPVFDATWFEDDAHFVWCVFLLCTSSYLETNVDCVWQLQWFTLIHRDSPCYRRFKAAQKIQAPVTQGWCMNSKGVQENYPPGN